MYQQDQISSLSYLFESQTKANVDRCSLKNKDLKKQDDKILSCGINQI